jgi:phospholipase C
MSDNNWTPRSARPRRVIAYDDSDGWYDRQAPVIVNGSNTSLDGAICSSSPIRLDSIPVRCGYSQRMPPLVISPWTRANSVNHQLVNTASIIRFVENNWLGGKRIGGGSFDSIPASIGGMFQFFAPRFDPVILDPTTGAAVKHQAGSGLRERPRPYSRSRPFRSRADGVRGRRRPVGSMDL